jgi:outer membrane protein assembly complex protein YaeT
VIRPGAATVVLWLSILGVAAGPAAAAPEEHEGRPIRAIEFDPESQPYSREYLEEILPLKAGQPLRLRDVRAAIERLYGTGRYADVQVDARPSDGGVILRLITRGSYFIGRVRVRGVREPPSEGVLINATRLELGALYTAEEARQATESLTDLLRRNGFFQCHIEPQFEYDPETQQVYIQFVIAPGTRARYTTPNVIGSPGRPASDVTASTHWKGWLGWKPVTAGRTDNGVRRVRSYYQKRNLLEARVALDGMEYDGLTGRAQPTLNIQGGPKIRIETVGAKVSRDKLKQLVPVFEEQSVDRDLLVEGANNLRGYLEGEGYFHAAVDFSSRSTGAGEETIQYQISRGDRHKVALVSIQGNRYFDAATIRERMYVRPVSFLQFRWGRYSEALLRLDTEAIAALYRANGFRDVEVTSRVEPGYGGKNTNLAVYINIREGPQWKVANLEIEGPSPENRAALESLLQSLPDQAFSEANVAIDRDNILNHYYNRGYSTANFSWSFTPAGPTRVNLKYVIQEGQQRFLRRFLLTGLETTDPKLVEDRLEMRPGEPLSRARLMEMQRRLYDLGIFARVDVAFQNPQGEERDKYLVLDLEEARKYTITTGFGAEFAKIGGCAACLDAPAGKAGFSPRASFGVTRRNFWGVGHIISFQSRVSTLEQRGVLSYQAPQFRGDPNVNLLFSALYDDSRDVRTFSARRREVSVQAGERLSRASTMLYRFSFRRVSVDRATLKISPELIPLLSQPARIGIAAVNFIQDRRDYPTDAHRGVYNTMELGWASRFFGSQADFTAFLGRNSSYHPLGAGKRFVLARSLTFGWHHPLRASTEIPLPERLFGGGATSQRGFPENQAGPRDLETGFPVGGQAVLVNQTELRFPLQGDNMSGVLFEDAGNVYSKLQHVSLRAHQRGLTDFDYMEHAVGFGLRYRTPVGPIRIDLAYSINPPKFYGFKGTLDELLHSPASCSQLASQPPQPGQARCLIQQIGHFQFHFSLGQAF